MIDLACSERDFQAAVIDLAHTFWWRVAHFRAGMNQRGVWTTPVSGDGAGYPDLHLVHPGRGISIYRELKSQKGRVEPRQQQWGEWLTAAGQDWAIWRPSDMPEIARLLSRGTAEVQR